jgi:hypothetical protein
VRKKQLRAEGAIDSSILKVTFQRTVDLNDPNNQMLSESSEDELGVERAFLAGLSAEDKALLVAHFTQEEKKKKKKKKKAKKEKKKERKVKKEAVKREREGSEVQAEVRVKEEHEEDRRKRQHYE